MSGAKTLVFEIAKPHKEAEGLAHAGYGHQTRLEAEQSLADDKWIDHFYRSTLKVFAVEAPSDVRPGLPGRWT